MYIDSLTIAAIIILVIGVGLFIKGCIMDTCATPPKGLDDTEHTLRPGGH